MKHWIALKVQGSTSNQRFRKCVLVSIRGHKLVWTRALDSGLEAFEVLSRNAHEKAVIFTLLLKAATSVQIMNSSFHDFDTCTFQWALLANLA